jgi:hypothetical protein
MRLTPLLCLLLLCPLSLPAGPVVPPGDDAYSLAQGQGWQLFAPAERQGLGDGLATPLSRLLSLYSQEFRWSLDEPLSLVMLSDKTQMANGETTIEPILYEAWYPGGAPQLEEFAASDWAGLLLAHESSHAFQLSAKQGPSRWIHDWLGSEFWLFAFTYPVALAPRLFLEGDAVYNEGRFGLGGRLYNGEMTARLLAMAKAGKISPASIINTRLAWPGAEEAYEAGSRFMASMARREGPAALNSVFLDLSKSYLVPTRLGARWQQHFDSSLLDDMADFCVMLKAQAQAQRSETSAAALATSWDRPALTRAGKRIAFLSDPDPDALPRLNLVDCASLSLSARRSDLPWGRLFEAEDGGWRSMASDALWPGVMAASLWDESGAADPAWMNRWLSDQRDGKSLWFDLAQGYSQPLIASSAGPLGISHSRAMLDAQGRSVFFRQSGTAKVCLRGGQELFRYQGYFGRPQWVGDDGSVWFIASTPLGCSLFEWDGQRLLRRSPSDTVVEAQPLDEGRVLAVQVEGAGYSVRALSLTAKEQAPAFLDPYGPAMESRMLDGVSETAATGLDWQAYHPLARLALRSITPWVWVGEDGNPTWSLGLNLCDELQQNALSLQSSQQDFGAWDHWLQWSYQRHLLAPYLAAEYQEVPTVLTSTQAGSTTYRVTGWDYQATAHVGLTLPIWQRRHDEAALGLDTRWEGSLKQAAPAVFSLSADRTIQPGDALLPWRQAALWAAVENGPDGALGGATLSLTQDLGHRFYATALSAGGIAPSAEIALSRVSPPVASPDRPALDTSLDGDWRAYAMAGAELTWAIGLDWEGYKVPLGIRRVAPQVQACFWSLKGAEDADRMEYRAGGILELLLLHDDPVDLSLYGTLLPQSQPGLQMGVGKRF